MNIFDLLKHYGSWTVKEERNFNESEISDVKNAVVVPSQYGASVCMMMKSGGSTYIPLAQGCSVGVGESVDLSKAKLRTLSKQGESDILRIVV